MKYYISTLVTGVDHRSETFDSLAREIDSWQEPDVGVELIAFTHDEAYWERLLAVLPELTCPRTFHGPWLGVEATSSPDSEAGRWLREAYTRVFDLAARYDVGHVVVHYSQLHFTPEELPAAQANAYANLGDLLELAAARGVNMAIENLAKQPSGQHLFTNEEYFALFERFPQARALIDVGHANVNKLPVHDFLQQYASRVVGYHLNNNDGEADRHWNIHRGTYDLRTHMRWAKEYTPEANVVLEYEPHVGLSAAELHEQIRELQAM